MASPPSDPPPSARPPPGPPPGGGPSHHGATPLWRSRRLWHPVGYTFTGLWMLGVLALTGGNSRHPLFDYIFVVPLAAWILGLIVAAPIKRRLNRP